MMDARLKTPRAVDIARVANESREIVVSFRERRAHPQLGNCAKYPLVVIVAAKWEPTFEKIVSC